MRKKKASVRPLVPGGHNFTAMHLVFQEHSIRVKPSLWCYFFAGLLLIPGIAFLLVQVIFLRSFPGDDWPLLGISALLLISCGYFAYLALRMIRNIRKRCRSFFDLSAQLFYPAGRVPHGNGGKKFPAIPFSELASLQIVEERCFTGKGSFDSCELNAVLNDGTRFNLLDHSNRECFAVEAEKLSQTLGIPLTDAQGNCLVCDDFLALPENVRENLLLGLGGVLLFIVLFALGNGRSWYLTRQSFHWEKIPARVERIGIRRHGGRHTIYSLDFCCRYRYRGQTYLGKRYNFFNPHRSQYAVEKIARQHPAGSRIDCYVNPAFPAQSVADRKIPSVLEMLFDSPWSCCFLILGLFALLKGAMQYRLLQKRRRK